MKIVTFNIRYAWSGDGINSFINRAEKIVKKIREESPDIIAFQEVGDKILEFLKANLKDYTIVGHGRDKKRRGEGVFTAYKNTVELVDVDTYWLSPTPNVPASRYKKQSLCPRTCVDALFSLADKTVRVINVHLDHVSDSARILGINQILNNIDQNLKDVKSSVIVLGDFNAVPQSDTIKACNDAGLVDVTASLPITFHNYSGVLTEEEKLASTDIRAKEACKIDYIYVDKECAETARNLKIYTDRAHGIYLSDHYPISVELF